MLMSELAHMRKLYNDIIYFVQNHVKPVAPSNTYPSSSSFLLSNSSTPISSNNNNITSSLMQKQPLNQLLAYNHHHHHHHPGNPIIKTGVGHNTNTPTSQVNISFNNSPSRTSHSSVTILEDSAAEINKTKLFGVPLQSKKRLHPEYMNLSKTSVETNKTRLIMEKDDLGLNLMPPSTC